MMLFIFCEVCGTPVRSSSRHCRRSRPVPGKRRLRVPKAVPKKQDR